MGARRKAMKKYAKEVGNANMANATAVKVVSGLFIVILPPLNLHHPPPLFTMEALTQQEAPKIGKLRKNLSILYIIKDT